MTDTSFLTVESRKYVEGIPKGMDWTKITAEMMKTFPVPEFPKDIPRPQVNIEKIQIPDLTDGHLIDVEVFRPKDAPIDEPLPALVYYFGGGFIYPAQEGHRYMATKWAAEVACAVLLVSYSLCPEHKFPVQLEESYSCISYITNSVNAQKLNIDPTRVAIGGDSSGGNLTAATMILIKQRAPLENSIKLQLLIYPSLDETCSSDTFTTNSSYGVNKDVVSIFYGAYRSEAAKDNVLFSPIRATIEELEGLPPTFILSAEGDVLRSENEEFGHKLLKAGVPVTSVRMNGVVHGFMSTPVLQSNDTLTALDMTGGALRRALAKSN